MASSSNMENNIPLNTIIHMLTIKLGSSNYLLWRYQIIPILSYQNLLNHVDGTGITPPSTHLEFDKSVENPAYLAWVLADQKMVIILHASLSKESVTLIVGLTTARQIWTALEAAYGNFSIERVHTIRDQLRLVQKGTKTVAEYGRAFKTLCDQLAAIGHQVNDSDQFHWFIAVLVRLLKPSLPLLDPLDLHHPLLTCLLELKAMSCFIKPYTVNDDIVKAFMAQCHVTSNTPDWYVDSGATYHMTASTNNISSVTPALGSDHKTSAGPRQM